MGRAEIGTVKYQSKQLKASGLQKLRFYCQICEKQCRDANGFKNHVSSLSHQNKIKDLSESGRGSAVIEEYSENFVKDFLRLLRMNHGTKKINANKFYQEYIINDKNHIHMNSTKWNTLTSLIRYLGKRGLVRVEQELDDNTGSEFNLEIRYIDSSSELSDQSKKTNRQKSLKNDEDVTMKLIEEQIKKGQDYLNTHKQNNLDSQEKQPIIRSSAPIKVSLKSNIKKKTSIKNAFGSDSCEEDEQDDSMNATKIAKKRNFNAITNRLLR